MKITVKGYRLLRMPDHPLARDGYVAEHRLVAQQHFGVNLLRDRLHVHHIDGDRLNNDPKNLLIVTPRNHRRLHNGWRKIRGRWWKECGSCKRFLDVAHCFYRSRAQVLGYCKECLLAKKRIRRAKGLPG